MRVYDWMMRNEKIILTLSIVIIATVHIIFLFKPVHTDAGAFLTISSGILKGNLPYVDYFDHKPPGVYYLLASFLAIKNSIYAAKLGTMLFNIATAVILFFIGKKLWNKEVGILSAIFYLTGLLVYGGNYILTEPFLAFFSSLAILCFVAHYYTKKHSYLFLSGIAIGISMLFKQTGILTLFGIFFFYLFEMVMSKRICVYIKNSAILFIGFLLPIILTLFYFYSVNVLNDLIYCVFSINLHSYPISGVVAFLYYNYNGLFYFPLIWILSISGVVIAVVQHFKACNKNQTKEIWEIFISIMLLFSAIPIVIRQFPHYYIQILPFASLLASYVMFELKEPIKSIFESDRLKIVAIFVILVLIAPTLVHVTNGVYSLKSYNLNDDIKVGDYIKSNTKPNEKIFVTGQPKYYFLSNREPMNKNIYLFSINLNNTYTEESVIQNLKDEKIRYVLVRVQVFKNKKIDAYIQDNYELKLELCKKSVEYEPITKVYKKKEVL